MNGYEFMLALAAIAVLCLVLCILLSRLSDVIVDQRRDIERLTEEIIRSNTQFRAEILHRNKKGDSK